MYSIGMWLESDVPLSFDGSWLHHNETLICAYRRAGVDWYGGTFIEACGCICDRERGRRINIAVRTCDILA